MKKLFLIVLIVFTKICAAQNVGIGTYNPTSKLEIVGSDTTDVKISASFTGAFGPTRLSFISDKNTAFEWRPGFIESADNGAGFGFNGRLDFYTNGSGAANKFGRVRAMSITNENVGIGTIMPTSKLNVNGQITIDQKNFGDYGGLLIKGDVPGNNYPNIAFTVKNSAGTPSDVVAAMIQGDLQNNTIGAEAIDLTFLNSSSGLGGLTEKMRIKNNGNVGIGVSNPQYKLHIGNNNTGLRIEGPTTAGAGGNALSIGGAGDIVVDMPGTVGGRFLIKENGYVGIGNNNPNTALTFAPSLGKKITLYPGATGDVGFGVAGNRLQIYADNPNADVAIGYDVAGTFNEKFAVKPTGALALSGNTGAAGQVLVSNGSAAPAQWQNPAASTATVINTAQTPYGANTYFLSGTTALELPNLQLTVTIPTGVTARLILSATVWMQTFGCFGPSTCIPSVGLFYMIDGSPLINAAVYHSAQANNVSSIVMANSPYNIGAGTHTIKWFLFNNGDNLSITAKPTFSSLMAFPL